MAAPLLLVTLGDPNGLGPELIAEILDSLGSLFPGRIVLMRPKAVAHLHPGLAHLPSLPNLQSAMDPPPGVSLYSPPELDDFTPTLGQAVPEGGRAAGLSLETALTVIEERRRLGLPTALTTCPLNKAMLNAAGLKFPGHTELLAERSGVGADKVCMHLCGPKLYVSLVTTHPPLADVPRLLSVERIVHCLQLTAEMMHTLGRDDKPIAVCGVNPHAGEWGTIGREEIDIIEPAVIQAQKAGMNVVGPLPGDTVFRFAVDGRFSSVLAMYHDQGLAPLKLLHFSEAVNVTLGLHFVRTSPDHGTGYDLVGTGKADAASLREAVKLAWRLSTTA